MPRYLHRSPHSTPSHCSQSVLPASSLYYCTRIFLFSSSSFCFSALLVSLSSSRFFLFACSLTILSHTFFFFSCSLFSFHGLGFFLGLFSFNVFLLRSLSILGLCPFFFPSPYVLAPHTFKLCISVSLISPHPPSIELSLNDHLVCSAFLFFLFICFFCFPSHFRHFFSSSSMLLTFLCICSSSAVWCCMLFRFLSLFLLFNT